MQKNILIIEDDLSIRELLKEFFTVEGYQVETASNGLEGLKKLREGMFTPSMILLDLMMPVMDGLKFYEHQRQDERFSPIPVVLMSGNLKSFAGALEDKNLTVLSKPVDLDVLSRTVTQVIQ